MERTAEERQRAVIAVEAFACCTDGAAVGEAADLAIDVAVGVPR
jgi:hypothetical protein